MMVGSTPGRRGLLGADDVLTLIEDEHVAEMAQADFNELVRGTARCRSTWATSMTLSA
jgi:hypothetical protein